MNVERVVKRRDVHHKNKDVNGSASVSSQFVRHDRDVLQIQKRLILDAEVEVLERSHQFPPQ